MGRSRFVVLTLAFALVASGCAWTQEGGNAGRTGYAPFEKTLTTANVSQATVKWWASAETRSPVIGNGFLYGSDGQALRGWQISTCTSSAQSCLPGWTTSNPVDAILDPALSGKHVLTAGLSNGRWALDAYDGTGHERCTTTSPVACSPLWSADLGANAPFGPSLLTVADGLAYVRGAGATEGGPTLVFDASGNSGCSGSPRTCSPLFQLEPSGPVLGPMAVSAGRAFFPTATGIEVFDANGTSGCSTGRCSALARFSISSPTPPSAESGTLFTTSGSTLYAFDTTLERNCTIGALRTCTAIWRATLRSGAREQPVIAGGRVFVATSTGSASTNAAEVFDAAGVLSCSATSHV